MRSSARHNLSTFSLVLHPFSIHVSLSLPSSSTIVLFTFTFTLFILSPSHHSSLPLKLRVSVSTLFSLSNILFLSVSFYSTFTCSLKYICHHHHHHPLWYVRIRVTHTHTFSPFHSNCHRNISFSLLLPHHFNVVVCLSSHYFHFTFISIPSSLHRCSVYVTTRSSSSLPPP